MLQQQERVGDLVTLSGGDSLVLQCPRVAVVDPSQPLGPQLHAPHDSRGCLTRHWRGSTETRPRWLRAYGISCLRANTTLAGRSANLRMYHGYQKSP